MKCFLILLALASGLFAADQPSRLPFDLLQQEGSLTLCDGASYFVFSKNGTFESFPIGPCGRTLNGKWTRSEAEDVLIISATGELGSRNGPVRLKHEYRKVVFKFTGSGSNLPPAQTDLVATAKKVENIYNGYWVITELTEVPRL